MRLICDMMGGPWLRYEVLNKSKGGIGASAETVAKIEEAAKRLGYTRNRSAAALKTGRQNTIGVMIHPLGAAGSGLTEAMVEGIAAEAGRLDQQLQLAFYVTGDDFDRTLRRMTKSAVDGLIVAGVWHPDLMGDLVRVRDEGMPVVTIYSTTDPSPLPNVGCDQVATGRIATEHLITQGCRRIAFIRRGEHRYQGYLEALDTAGIPFSEELVYGDDSGREITFEDGMAAAEHLLGEKIDFDGMIASCDLYAMGAMRIFDREGVRVGEDVKLVGVDNSPTCDYATVPLSSISSVLAERAAKAVQMLMTAEDGEKVESVLLPPVLFPRSSSGVGG